MSAVLIDKKVQGHEGIWLLTLNHPEASNAINDEMIAQLEEVLHLATQDQSCRVIMLTGAGKSFCAGGDVKAMKDRSGMFAGDPYELKRRYQAGIQRIPLAMEKCDKPIIALVNGAAIGAGCDLACMADLRLAAQSARFGETFCKLGLVPGDGGAYFLSRIIGYSRALEMFLTGDIYNAQAALEMGLVTKICPDNELLSSGIELARRIAANAPVAISLTKRAIKESRRQELSSHLELIASYQGISQRTSDHFEGVNALLEKRTPEFKGL